jgi:hypothetical protein
MDPKEFYAKKAALLSQLSDALMTANELSMNIRGLELRCAADVDDEMVDELRILSQRLEVFDEYATIQIISLEPFTK